MLVESVARSVTPVARETVQTDVAVRNVNDNVEAKAQQAPESSDLSSDTGARQNFQRPENGTPPGLLSAASTRLNYDNELKRLFIEIVDEDSGRVLNEVPPRALALQVQRFIEENQRAAEDRPKVDQTA